MIGKLLRDITTIGREYSVSTLSSTELARQLLYMIRAHYADPDHGNDGRVLDPLYCGSIEGIGGSSSQTVAQLKGLPRPEVQKEAKDYKMISPYNLVPKIVRTDVSCMMNDFQWDRCEVQVEQSNGEWKTDDELSRYVRGLYQESEARDSWKLNGWICGGAAEGDVYARIKPDVTYETGVRIDTAKAMGVYPHFDIWNARKVESYRLIYKILATEEPASPEQSPLEHERETHVERVNAMGVDVFRDEIPVTHDEAGNRMSGPHPEGLDEIPMVHVAYRDSGSFFGIPAADADVISAIDQANIHASNMASVGLQGFGVPNLFLWGISDVGDWKWGRRGVHGGPVDGKAEILHYEGLPELLQMMQMSVQALRDKIVQLIIDDVRMGGSADESGVALAIRLFPYDSYLAELEKQFTAGLEAIARIALKITRRMPARKIRLKLDWGARFPVDIMARLNAGKMQLDMFGQVPELIEDIARREGFTKELIASIGAFHKTKVATEQQAAATQAHGGGLFGAQRAEEVRQQRLLEAGAGPAGREV